MPGRRFVPACLLLALALLLPACRKSGTTTQPSKDGPPQADSGTQTAEKITAVALNSELRKDGKGNSAKFSKRPFEVTGVVSFVGNRTVNLVGVEPSRDAKLDSDGLRKSGYNEFEQVSFRFEKDNNPSHLALVPGQTATIRGVYSGTVANVPSAHFSQSEVVSSGEIPLKRYTMPDLRKALGKRPKTAVPKELAGPIILEGTLKKVEQIQGNSGFYSLTVEDASPSDEPPLTVRIGLNLNGFDSYAPGFNEYARNLTAGSPFRAHGKLGKLKGQYFLTASRRPIALLPK